MTISFQWQITKLNVEKVKDDLEDVIQTILWRLIAVDDIDGLFVEKIGKTQLPPPENNNFTAFDSLTEEQVIGWLETMLPIDDLKEQLIDKIEDSRNPKIVEKTAPWLSKT